MYLIFYIIGCTLSLVTFIVSKAIELKNKDIKKSEKYGFIQIFFIFLISWVGVGLFSGLIVSLLIFKKK